MDDLDSSRGTQASDGTELLLRFVADRDHGCPTCDYNLRNLTQPVCPECGEELKLTVGRQQRKDALLFVTIAPCSFSGICAILLNGLIVYVWFRSGGLPPPEVWGADGFGVLSGIIGIMLFVKRRAFMRLEQGVQFFWALLAWAIHIAAFVVLVVSM